MLNHVRVQTWARTLRNQNWCLPASYILPLFKKKGTKISLFISPFIHQAVTFNCHPPVLSRARAGGEEEQEVGGRDPVIHRKREQPVPTADGRKRSTKLSAMFLFKQSQRNCPT